MLAAFWIASDLPLASAVWLIPALYLMRATLIVRALAGQIAVTTLEIFQSMRGGALLAALAVGLWFTLSTFGSQAIIFDLIRLILCSLACVVALRLSSGRLLGAETKALLLNRRQDSGTARVLLKLAGVK
jgi:hypothetical protein